MTMLKTPGAPSIFSVPSYINGDTYNAGGLVASTMQTLAHRLYQMDPSAIWQGSAGASDSDTETFTVTFYAGSLAVQRVIDTILILNNNLNNFSLDYSTNSGSTWTNIATVTGNGGLDYQLFLASPITIPATTGRLKLTMTTTLPANLQKFVGNFIATQSLFQLGVSTTPIRPQSKFVTKPAQTVKQVMLADGTIDSTYFFWSDNSCILNDLEFEFDLAPISDKLNIDALMASAQAFLCYPEPGDNIRNIYLCVFSPGTYQPQYTSSWKGAGYKLPFTLKQVGYV